MELVQGTMSMTGHEAKFMELARFCRHQVENETRKACKFARGLKSSIRSKFVMLPLWFYTELVTRAIKVEKDFVELLKSKD